MYHSLKEHEKTIEFFCICHTDFFHKVSLKTEVHIIMSIWNLTSLASVYVAIGLCMKLMGRILYLNIRNYETMYCE